MILRALYDYYQRSKQELPRYGRELMEIAFVIVIDREGRFLRFEDRRHDDKKSAQKFTVRSKVVRTIKVTPNWLFDNSDYVLGVSDKGDVMAKYDAFRQKIDDIFAAHPDNADLRALHRFYQTPQPQLLGQLQASPLWQDIRANLNKKFSYFTFLIDGETRPLAAKDELIDIDIEVAAGKGGNQVCLVTGQKGAAVDITSAAPIAGSRSNAKLVAMQKSSGYDSYGKSQGGNAPISEEAEFAYSTAIRHLLRSGSRNKFQLASRTFLFWASSDDETARQAEASFFSLVAFADDADDPQRNIAAVRKVFEAIYTGQMRTNLDDRFFILGLAPNAARIAVTYWAELPLKEFAQTICRHFDDMALIDTRPDKRPYTSLRNILSTVTLGGKVADATPNLPDALVRSIFQGLPYPQTLFASCIRRIRAETGEKDKSAVHITRAAIIKAYLNRLNNNQQPIHVMLDKDNTNQGYLCGRLFAVLDKIQEEANQQHSIRERYMNAASSTPAAIFSTILNLSVHHAENLQSEGRRIYFERLKQEIISKIDADGFRPQLDLQDQGRFFIGYYHQRQDFFTPAAETSNE